MKGSSHMWVFSVMHNLITSMISGCAHAILGLFSKLTLNWPSRSSRRKESDPTAQNCLTCTPSFIYVHNLLYLALLNEKQAKIVSRNVLNQNFIVIPLSMSRVNYVTGAGKECTHSEKQEPQTDHFIPPSLGDIFQFHEFASALDRKYPRKKLVFQTGLVQNNQMKTAFLLGCHMIMNNDVDYERTCLAFKDFHSLFHEMGPDSPHTVSIQSCWRAFCAAKSLRWIDFNSVIHADPDEDRRIHMAEYMHYAR
jgi:hypothetical protein